MKPTYQVKVWPDEDWWLAQVIAASEGTDTTPLNALTQARSLAKVDSMARDLIATILDADEEDFAVDFVYQLPDDINEVVCQARGAREWADAAQELWQDRSTIAARALAEKGYSLRETATLLGLSHQRVDQLLASPVERELMRSMLVYWCDLHRDREDVPWPKQSAQAVLVFRAAHDHGREALGDDEAARARDSFRAFACELASQLRLATEDELEARDAG